MSPLSVEKKFMELNKYQEMWLSAFSDFIFGDAVITLVNIGRWKVRRDFFSFSARSYFLAQFHFPEYLWNLNSQYRAV